MTFTLICYSQITASHYCDTKKMCLIMRCYSFYLCAKCNLAIPPLIVYTQQRQHLISPNEEAAAGLSKGNTKETYVESLLLYLRQKVQGDSLWTLTAEDHRVMRGQLETVDVSGLLLMQMINVNLQSWTALYFANAIKPGDRWLTLFTFPWSAIIDQESQFPFAIV